MRPQPTSRTIESATSADDEQPAELASHAGPGLRPRAVFSTGAIASREASQAGARATTDGDGDGDRGGRRRAHARPR